MFSLLSSNLLLYSQIVYILIRMQMIIFIEQDIPDTLNQNYALFAHIRKIWLPYSPLLT